MNQVRAAGLRLTVLAALCFTAFGAVGVRAQPVMGEQPQTVSDLYLPEVEGVTVEVWVDSLDIPWSLLFLPNGDALVAERRGQIQRIPHGQDRPDLYVQLDEVAHVGDGGLMGLTLDPQFASRPYLYAAYMYKPDPQEEGLSIKVVRLRHLGSTCQFDRILLDHIPGASVHIGGRVAFGPDGFLYVGTGDLWQQPISQDLNSLAGKILRITGDGEIPSDNPFPNSPVYSYGHRVVQGLAWDPETGAMFNSEHGSSGEWPGVNHRDEVNRIVVGGNYGWPEVVGAPRLPGYQDPIAMWKNASVPPAGMTFYRGDLFLATLGSQALFRISFKDRDSYAVERIERWFAWDSDSGIYGRLRDVTVGPDGYLYVITSNTDGRAQLRLGDDKILRLKIAEK